MGHCTEGRWIKAVTFQAAGLTKLNPTRSNEQDLPPDPHRFDGDHDGIGCES
jgi:hypothetical protein